MEATQSYPSVVSAMLLKEDNLIDYIRRWDWSIPLRYVDSENPSTFLDYLDGHHQSCELRELDTSKPQRMYRMNLVSKPNALQTGEQIVGLDQATPVIYMRCKET